MTKSGAGDFSSAIDALATEIVTLAPADFERKLGQVTALESLLRLARDAKLRLGGDVSGIDLEIVEIHRLNEVLTQRVAGQSTRGSSPRAARLRQYRARDYLALLRLARRAKIDIGGDTILIDHEIAISQELINQLNQHTKERIEPRRRTPAQVPAIGQSRPEYLVFLDECGIHGLGPQRDPFPVFCLCSIAIAKDEYEEIETRWQAWKQSRLGGINVRVHEPTIRKRSGPFYRRDMNEQQDLLNDLEAILRDFTFTSIAVVIDKQRFHETFAAGRVDEFLPPSLYLIAVDFLFERLVHFLYRVGNDARGLVVAESRGSLEDALVHAEFLRLHLDGTQWQSDSQFRRAFRPYMEFWRKERNCCGLEIADILARPIAEKVLRPTSEPERWDLARRKLYTGGQGRIEGYGLKVFPALESEWLRSLAVDLD